jgi:hypothetical protein
MAKGKRNSKAAVALTAALASTLSGCATGWQAVREDWRQLDRTPNYESINEKKTETNKQFDIPSILTIGGEYFADVKQKSTQEVFNETSTRDFVRYKKVLQEKNTTTFPIYTLIGIPSMAALAGIYAKANHEEDRVISIDIGLGAILGALVGGGLDYLIGAKSEKSRIRETGDVKEVLENEKIQRERISSYINELPAGGIKVVINGINCRTDLNGKANVSDAIESAYPNYFCRQSDFSGKGMENRIRTIPLVTGLKPKTLDMLMKKLVGEADPVMINISLRTDEKPSQGEKITNWTGTAKVNGYKLSDEDIYKVIGDFINQDINSRIGTIRFDLKDLVSRTPIDGATFAYKTNAPSKEDLINQYFNEKLKSFADSRIKDYLAGGGWFNVGDSTNLEVYSPSMMHVEFTNPDYRFVEGDVFVNKPGMKKIVYMADKGSKVRIDSTNDGNGKIE